MSGGPTTLLGRLAAAGSGFFHAPRDLRICALVRIGYALCVLIWLAVLFPDLQLWFGENGVLPLAGARQVMTSYSWSLLQWTPADNAFLYGAYATAILQTLLLLAGFWSRFNAACVFIWIVSFADRNTLILDAEDAVFRLVGFFLILMPCGARWSIDAALTARRDPHSALRTHGPAWGLRLLQIQMCLIFLSAALCKLEAPEWRDGSAMYYVARLDDYFGRFPTPDLLWQTPSIVRLITWSAVAAELLIPLLIWWPPARRWALLAALLFHLANEYTMHLFLFHWIMLVGWASFLTGDDLDWLGRVITGRRAATIATEAY
jgi:uncharacterized membrane protein YphA (DoxX/SURF4 family)